jgi:hypothetical protein
MHRSLIENARKPVTWLGIAGSDDQKLHQQEIEKSE